MEDFSKNINHEINESKTEIKLNYNSKTKLNAKRRLIWIKHDP